ncbi:hypothetical protein AGMMS50268_38110 [Spirochaetia bacterium]|nr:hypothetical protein AGMMS50268_38110 [Spirochaetia bacterium]
MNCQISYLKYPEPVKQGTTSADRAALVSRLTPAEHEIYLWLRQCFSISWIAETLEMKKRQVKILEKKSSKPWTSSISGNWSGITPL